MLFNSQVFILLFFPIVVAGYLSLPRAEWRQWFIVLSSLIFYAYADLWFLPYLIGSVIFNWGLGHAVNKNEKRYLLLLGIAANLGLLGYFKYSVFILGNLYAFTDLPSPITHVLLPIGISFFTFQQISFLVDRWRGVAPTYGFREYAFFVVYFPQLIAGPIVRHQQIIPQLSEDPWRIGYEERFGRGAILFTLGLTKKVVFADQFAKHANAVFAQANDQAVSILDAWTGALSFAFQIYFDFSAYSDMAIGLGLIMGLGLPLNFNAPYQAKTIQDFWRRWHITLSNFFRDYVYIPLGGNRHGEFRYVVAAVGTMGLCGLWHGAGWPFVIWGLWHGAGLITHHFWRKLDIPMPLVLSWGLTLLFVLLGWVLFRAETIDSAYTVYGSMFGLQAAGPSVAEGFNLILGAVAAAYVLYLPGSVPMVLTHMKPKPIFAAIAAIVFVGLTLEVGKGDLVEFIYFEF